MYIQINELEKDILREIMHVGISKAADAFAVLTNSENAIILCVPNVNIVGSDKFREVLKQHENAVMVIKTELIGDLAGLSVLPLNDEQTEWIVQNSLSEKDLKRDDLPALRLSLLLETSNILTGALITQLVNILGIEVVGLPPVQLHPGREQSITTILTELSTHQLIALSFRTDFKNMFIEMPLLLILEVGSLSNIMGIIRQKVYCDSELLKKQISGEGNSAEISHSSAN